MGSDYTEIDPKFRKTIHLDNASLYRLLQMGDEKNGPWVAGGAALSWYLGESINSLTDVDVFFKDSNSAEKLQNKIMQFSEKGLIGIIGTFDTPNARTFTICFVDVKDKPVYKIQLIRKIYFDTIHDVLNQFDLSICKIGTDGRKFYLGDNTARHIHNRTFDYEKEFTQGAYLRILKYETYGYRPTEQLQAKIKEADPMIYDFSLLEGGTDEYETGL